MSKHTHHGFAKARSLATDALKHFAIAALPDRLKLPFAFDPDRLAGAGRRGPG